MHTFFINTSETGLYETGDFQILVDIPLENRMLVTLDCPLSKWMKQDEGYHRCARQMSEKMNDYLELSNEFNIILYMDLTAYKPYSALLKEQGNERARESCLSALRLIYPHFIKSTLLADLTLYGRLPKEVLLIFGEERRASKAEVNVDQIGFREALFTVLGLPGTDVIKQMATKLNASNVADKAATMLEQIKTWQARAETAALSSCFDPEIGLWCQELFTQSDVEASVDWLTAHIVSLRRAESERHQIETVSFVQSSIADTVNNTALTLDRLNLLRHILSCVEAGTIYQRQEGRRAARPMEPLGAKAFSELLAAKRREYQGAFMSLERVSNLFHELKLAPELYQVDKQSFGLNRFGGRAETLRVEDVPAEGAEKAAGGSPAQAIGSSIEKELIAAVRRADVLLPKDQLPPFPELEPLDDEPLQEKNAEAQLFLEYAARLRRRHMEYLHSLRQHESELLSNYAGRSEDNNPPILEKRKISVAEEGYADAARDYRYTGKNGRTRETQKIKTVQTFSQKAYDTVEDEFVRYCAGRTVSLVDIEDQCNWFVTRVEQIRDSLGLLKRIALFMLIGLLLAYVPFLAIEWSIITESVVNAAIAGAWVAVPLLALCVVYGVCAAKQRQEYRKAWNILKERSEAALAQNQRAAEEYYRLLASVIPSLRWLYEYRLDVDFYTECCKLATAKLNHHKEKLHGRIISLKNLVENLGFGGMLEDAEPTGAYGIPDYSTVFCAGEKNIRFYTVLNSPEDRKEE